MKENDLRKLDDEMLDAFRAHDTKLILSHCSNDVVIHDFGAPPVKGKKEARPYLEAQFAPFSKETLTRPHRIIGDAEVFSELAWSAPNSGDIEMPDGPTIPATGKKLNTRIAYYARVNDKGEVAEMRSYMDVADIMSQLGLMGS